ncbi:hypothetical protein TrST_g850 [Triparma strigata]|uniref:Uncharacterized protein n=1 Tax=Triparma strigata TaxID=1606541 RepID=A0A9W7BCC8_9STRA|nr:hypothetical protein TrST_g850 [Triparma strigata]
MEFDTSGGGAEANKTPNSLQIASTSTSMKSNPTAAAETSSSHSTTTTSRHNDAPATISNKNLGDLRREREERAVTNGHEEAASLALARSLSQHHPSAASSSSSDEAASLALARLLSQEQQPLISPSLPLTALYAHLKSDANRH